MRENNRFPSNRPPAATAASTEQLKYRPIIRIERWNKNKRHKVGRLVREQQLGGCRRRNKEVSRPSPAFINADRLASDGRRLLSVVEKRPQYSTVRPRDSNVAHSAVQYKTIFVAYYLALYRCRENGAYSTVGEMARTI